jgi:hypothetical protein
MVVTAYDNLAKTSVQPARIGEAGFALESNLNRTGNHDSSKQGAYLEIIFRAGKADVELRTYRNHHGRTHAGTSIARGKNSP